MSKTFSELNEPKKNSPILNFESVTIESGENSGGFSGSKKVEKVGKSYQYKFSSRLKKRFQKLKAKVKGGTDHENIGELIGAKMLEPIAKKMDVIVPEISFATCQKNHKGVDIVSKYMDEAFKPLYNTSSIPKDAEIRYLKLNFNAGKDRLLRKGDKYKIEAALKDEHKQSVSDGVFLNAFIGNADINAKGNIGLTGGKIGIIDFGHGFNNLIAGAKQFGGGVKGKNGILDFINRDKVLKVPFGGESKLWRDYEGLMPSPYAIKSLDKIIENGKAYKEGAAKAEVELNALLDSHPEKADMVLKSLNRLNRNIGEKPIKGTVEEVVKGTMQNMQSFCGKRIEEMKEVKKIMEIQLGVDKMLANTNDGREAFQELQYQYDKAFKNQKITWVKTSAKDKPIKGNLVAYINARREQLKTQQELEKKYEAQKANKKPAKGVKAVVEKVAAVLPSRKWREYVEKERAPEEKSVKVK